VWTLDQAAQYKKADNWPTAGNVQLYIEDVFSTYLYTGTDSTQTITNGIDLSTKGGLVWTKSRSTATNPVLVDTVRGSSKTLNSDTTGAQGTYADITSFNTTGYSLSAGVSGWFNTSPRTYASWTFRKQAKFFDIVTYTGDGTSNRAINHSLNAVPGCVIVKKTNAAQNWSVWHRTFTTGDHMYLNTTGAVVNNTVVFGSNPNTSTTFNVGSFLNANGDTYVAYLFAHNAGGFGLTGTDNVISCGSYTGNGSANGPTVTLGYEPQWVMVKEATVGGAGRDWLMFDSMRGMTATPGIDFPLRANTSQAEDNGYGEALEPTATGFKINAASGSINSNGNTFIYIAIRRGPMKVPTSGTSVFSPNTSSSPAGTVITTGFPLDASLTALRAGGYGNVFLDRLRGIVTIPYGVGANSAYLVTNTTGAEQSLSSYSAGVNNTGFQIPNTWADSSTIYYSFRRAPGFFDVVCWSATAASTQNHNLQVVPELAIFKYRTSTSNWWVYSAPVGLGSGRGMYLNGTDSSFSGIQNPITAISSSTFTTGLFFGGGGNWVTYLFATLAGVSKVGSYTGTGTTQTINCGFTAGSRFVMIKRTDSTGDWYVWDSARGIVAGNDPYLLLNSTAAEVTSTDYIDTAASGFEISSTAPAAINANGGTFIFLAIA